MKLTGTKQNIMLFTRALSGVVTKDSTSLGSEVCIIFKGYLHVEIKTIKKPTLQIGLGKKSSLFFYSYRGKHSCSFIHSI